MPAVPRSGARCCRQSPAAITESGVSAPSRSDFKVLSELTAAVSVVPLLIVTSMSPGKETTPDQARDLQGHSVGRSRKRGPVSCAGLCSANTPPCNLIAECRRLKLKCDRDGRHEPRSQRLLQSLAQTVSDANVQTYVLMGHSSVAREGQWVC